jgi:hypothetical protein
MYCTITELSMSVRIELFRHPAWTIFACQWNGPMTKLLLIRFPERKQAEIDNEEKF